MTHDVEIIVVGAGVIGLACARALSCEAEVFLLESQKSFGSQTSSRNSEVLHSGIYYPSHFLKTQLCIAGNQSLYSYCQQKQIPHQAVGKLIVATNAEQIPALSALQAQAYCNGIAKDSVKLLDRQALFEKEAELQGEAALWVRTSGIIDSHAYMQQLEADIFNSGSQVLYQQEVRHIEALSHGFRLQLNDKDTIVCKKLVLCAGLHNQSLALGPAVPKLYPCKGHYFNYQGSSPFHHLIYPLPDANNSGLGIHATINTQKQLRFGPDVFYQQGLNLNFESGRKAQFVEAIQRYWPTLDADKLQEDYCGIRPKIQAPNGTACDFMIQDQEQHGHANLLQLFGIESPGLTASLAIGNYVKNKLCP